jgi:hypothetical protein
MEIYNMLDSGFDVLAARKIFWSEFYSRVNIRLSDIPKPKEMTKYAVEQQKEHATGRAGTVGKGIRK